MSKRIINRREFLLEAGKVAAAVVVLEGVTSIVAGNGAWAMSLKVIEPHSAEVLLTMTRRLYPHDHLGDLYYAEAVELLDAKAVKDPELAKLIKEGVAELDKVMGVPWLRLSEGVQLEALTKISDKPFFQKVRGHTVVALYDNKLVWQQFGYQGSSAEHGGYLYRGFQDAGWTLVPPADASPAPYLG